MGGTSISSIFVASEKPATANNWTIQALPLYVHINIVTNMNKHNQHLNT